MERSELFGWKALESMSRKRMAGVVRLRALGRFAHDDAFVVR
jgi:hypothetical protein